MAESIFCVSTTTAASSREDKGGRIGKSDDDILL
jgi:hypothetical protein